MSWIHFLLDIQLSFLTAYLFPENLYLLCEGKSRHIHFE